MINIISIHIGKTAGSSFLEILKDQYGEDHVYQYIDRRNPNSKLQTIKQYYKKNWAINHLPQKYEVIHGHIFYKYVKKLKEKNNAKVIAWLRNPVDRIISRYLFLMKRIEMNAQHPSRCFKDYSIIDFASRDCQQNVMTQYLDGIDLEDLFFFGFQENFEQDINELGTKLIWDNIAIPTKLDNKAYKEKNKHLINDDVIARLKELNAVDISLYQRALQLKGKSVSL